MKFTIYGFLLNLPTYISEKLLHGKETETSEIFIANTMSLIEYGTIFGGLILGHISDLTYGKRSPVIIISLLISCLIILYLGFNMKNLYENDNL